MFKVVGALGVSFGVAAAIVAAVATGAVAFLPISSGTVAGWIATGGSDMAITM